MLFLDFCITFWSQLKCHVLTILARTVTLLLHQLLPLCSVTLFYFLLKFYFEFFLIGAGVGRDVSTCSPSAPLLLQNAGRAWTALFLILGPE